MMEYLSILSSLNAPDDVPVSAQTDEAWISGIAAGNTDDLRSLYDAAKSAVYGYALSILKDSHDAQDVLQDVFLKIRSSAHTYSAQGKPMAWIMTITRNLCLMKLREQKRGLEKMQEDDAPRVDYSNIKNAEDRMVLSAAMEILSPQERSIVLMHATAGMKHREIAQVMQLNVSTVLSKYTRALSKLRQYLREEEK